MQNIKDIQNAFYINLEYRPDRREHVEKEMLQLGIPVQRFSAIRLDNGRIGCSLSHLKCLRIARDNQWSHVLIVEDDIYFTDPSKFQKQLNNFLSSEVEWDVVLFAGNNIPPYKPCGTHSIQVSSCQTTTGYMVKQHYYDILIDNIRTGITLLMKNPTDHYHYAIDKYWFPLQSRDKWFLITPLTVVQKEDFSNIENRITNYSRLMLDIDKTEMIKKRQQSIQWKMPIEHIYHYYNSDSPKPDLSK